MKPVIQEDRTGCGIAAVAAAAGVSYGRAKRAAAALGISVHDQSLWSQADHVRKLLRHFKIKANAKPLPFRSWKSLPDFALLSVKWHLETGKPCWHWVLFVREGRGSYVLDSKKALHQNTRTDFGRMKPKWYIGLALAA